MLSLLTAEEDISSAREFSAHETILTPHCIVQCTTRFSLYKLLHACHGVPLNRQYLDVLPTVHLEISTLWLGDTQVHALF